MNHRLMFLARTHLICRFLTSSGRMLYNQGTCHCCGWAVFETPGGTTGMFSIP